MSLDNLTSVTFSDVELHKLSEAITTIEDVTSGKTINFTKDQREQYTRIANQNKRIIDKAKNYMEEHPAWMPDFLDKEEFDRDYNTRLQIEKHILALKNLTQQLIDTKILLDYESYANALSFYRVIRYLAGKNEPGVKNVYDEMKVLFGKNDAANT